MEQRAFKNVNNCLNTNIYSNLETSGGQSSILYLNVVNFSNTSVNWTSVAVYDSCFPALMSNSCSSIGIATLNRTNFMNCATAQGAKTRTVTMIGTDTDTEPPKVGSLPCSNILD